MEMENKSKVMEIVSKSKCTSFKELYRKDMIADMLYILIVDAKDANKKLTDSMIRSIGKYLLLHDECVLTNTFFEIRSNPKDFAEDTRNYEDNYEHSWDGMSKTRGSSVVLYGDIELGYFYRDEYYTNGELTYNKQDSKIADFDITKPQIVITKMTSIDKTGNKNLTDCKYIVYLYLEDGFEISTQMQEVLDNYRVF